VEWVGWSKVGRSERTRVGDMGVKYEVTTIKLTDVIKQSNPLDRLST
jgi:hypothetical protein